MWLKRQTIIVIIKPRVAVKRLLGKMNFWWLQRASTARNYSAAFQNFREKHNFWGILIEPCIASSPHTTRQKWFDDAQIKLIHLEIDRLAQRHQIIFPDFINKNYTHNFWMLAIKLSIARRVFLVGLWLSCHHPPLLLRSRDSTFSTCFLWLRIKTQGIKNNYQKILYWA